MVIPVILTAIYLLGRYISRSQEVFVNNFYGSFMTGVVAYLFITFIIFFPFLWIKIDILYFVIIFSLKEITLYIFLLLKWEGKINKTSLIKFAIIIVSGVFISLIYNYGISKIVMYKPTNIETTFQTWDKTRLVFQRLLDMEPLYAVKWFMTIIASVIAFASVGSFIGEFRKKDDLLTEISSFIVTLVIMTLFTFGLGIYQLVGMFILMFMIILALRLIKFSRRRYGALYGVSTIALYSSSQKMLIVVLLLSLVTMIIYTFLQKPKNSLFWVQLFAPIGIVAPLAIYDLFPVLSFVVFGFALFAYIFVVTVGRASFMRKVNIFFNKGRYIIPSLILFVLMITSLILYTTTSYKFFTFKDSGSFVYSSFTDTDIERTIQMIIYYTSLVVSIGLIGYWLLRKRKLTNIRTILVSSILVIIFVYNPIIGLIFNKDPFSESFTYLKIIVYVPIILLIPSLITMKKKHIA